MPRVAALIVRDSTGALIERHRTDGHYYLFPSGGVEPDAQLITASVTRGWPESCLLIIEER